MIIGKPAAQYFLAALQDMQINPEEVNVETIKIMNFLKFNSRDKDVNNDLFYSTTGIMVFFVFCFLSNQCTKIQN